MPLGLFDVPLYDKRLMGNDPKTWINRRMGQQRRIEDRPIGNKLLSFRIYDVMRNSLGFADPKLIRQELNKKKYTKLYPDGKKLAEKFSKRPTIAEQGRKHQEEVIGTVRSRNFTEHEFQARKKITKSLIKLTKKLTARMRIILLTDHEETRVKEKIYFNERLQAKKALILQEMLSRFPDEREYTKAAIMKERTNVMNKTNELLEEELTQVQKLKEKYLNKAYDFQVNWQLKNVGDYYQKKINAYSLSWSEMFTEMKIVNMLEMVNPNSEGSKTLLQEGTVENLIEYLSNVWKENICNTRNEFNEELNKVKQQLEDCEKLITVEKKKRDNLLSMINLSSSFVKNIVEQYEKLVVYGYRGTPGLCNFFLSFRMLEELHQKFVEKAWEKKKAATVSCLPEKRSFEELEVEDEENEKLFRDPSSYEVDIFKSCRDIEKINLFRTNVLRVKNLIEEVKCAVLREPLQVRERMADFSVELKTMSESHLETTDSRFILNKLTDAYHLLENSLRKSPPLPKMVVESLEKKEEPVSQRVEDIVQCFRRHPHLLASFANV